MSIAPIPDRVTIIADIEQLAKEAHECIVRSEPSRSVDPEWVRICTKLKRRLGQLQQFVDEVPPVLWEIVAAGRDAGGFGGQMQPEIWREYESQRHANIVELLAGIKLLAEFPRTIDTPEDKIEVVAGGFRYAGKHHSLTGRQLQMLVVILDSKYHCCTRDTLRESLGVDDTVVEYPDQVISDTAKKLRAVLRKAVKDAGHNCGNPLPSTGRGADLSYSLTIP